MHLITPQACDAPKGNRKTRARCKEEIGDMAADSHSESGEGTPVEMIVVTDGDATAWRAVQAASSSLGLVPVAVSRGNPTRVDARRIVEVARAHSGSPVVVMVDDQGDAGAGPGEKVLAELLRDERVRVLGVVAVASNTPDVAGVLPEVSVDQTARVSEGSVDKEGQRSAGPLLGDTVDVLRKAAPGVVIVGLGDPGKMQGGDALADGVPATRAALAAVLARAGRRRD